MKRIYFEAIRIFVQLDYVEPQISLDLDLMHNLATVQRQLMHSDESDAISIGDVQLPTERHQT